MLARLPEASAIYGQGASCVEGDRGSNGGPEGRVRHDAKSTGLTGRPNAKSMRDTVPRQGGAALDVSPKRGRRGQPDRPERYSEARPATTHDPPAVSQEE